MNLIDRDKFIIELNDTQIEFDEYYKGLGKAKSLLIEQPIVDAKPVVHAKWVNKSSSSLDCNGIYEKVFPRYVCTNCEHSAEVNSNFCPNCGAIMDQD